MENALLLTEEADIRKIKAGPDVHCPYCHARNPADGEFCGACGGGLADAEARESGHIIGALRAERGLEKECPHCGTLNSVSSLECSGCGGSLPARREESGEKASPSTSSKGLPKLAGFGCLAIVLIGAAIFLFSLLSKDEMIGIVQGVEWTHTVPILEQALTEQEDWFEQIPAEAEIIRCQEEVRGVSEEPVAGAIEVCGTPYTIDEGSGYGEVVQDCTYEVYDDYCVYTVLDWVIVDEVVVSDTDLNPYWPELSLDFDQQAGEGQSEYFVTFQTDEGIYRYTPDDALEFSEYWPGSSWVLEVNRLGGVLVIEPSR
jgi:hypothetical protein